MNNKDLPAYPVSEELTDRIDAGIKIYYGLTKLEAFMLRAPAEPHEWFEPEMPDKPNIPQWENIEDHGLKEEMRLCFDCDSDPETPAGIAWMEAYKASYRAWREWQSEKVKQRLIQWPRAWAEEVLAELEKRT